VPVELHVRPFEVRSNGELAARRVEHEEVERERRAPCDFELRDLLAVRREVFSQGPGRLSLRLRLLSPVRLNSESIAAPLLDEATHDGELAVVTDRHAAARRPHLFLVEADVPLKLPLDLSEPLQGGFVLFVRLLRVSITRARRLGRADCLFR
jgi:hypothetical protein